VGEVGVDEAELRTDVGRQIIMAHLDTPLVFEHYLLLAEE